MNGNRITPRSGNGNGHGRSYDYEHASTREIERNIERTRADMDQTLDAIGRRLSPSNLIDQAMCMVRGHTTSDELMHQAKSLGASLGSAIQRHPIPALLCGAGLAWLLVEKSDENQRRQHYDLDSLREHSGSYVDARTGRPYDDDYESAWQGAAWSKNYDWSRSSEDEASWTQRAEHALGSVKSLLSDESVSLGDKMKHVGGSLMSLSNRKRREIRQRLDSLREHSGSYVDARTGRPYDEHYGEEFRSLSACDFAASHDWTPEHEASWSEQGREYIDKMSHTLSDAGATVKDKTRQLGAHLADFLRSTGQTLESRSRGMQESMQHAMSGARSGARQAGSSIRHGAEQMQHQLGDAYAAGVDHYRRAIDQQPLAVGAAFLGLGLIAGLALPRTRTEDRYLGPSAEQARKAAKQAGSEMASRAQHVGQTALHAAQEEAEKYGLTADKLSDRAEQLVESSASTAREMSTAASQIVKRATEEAAADAESQVEAMGAEAEQAAKQSTPSSGGPTRPQDNDQGRSRPATQDIPMSAAPGTTGQSAQSKPGKRR